MDHGQPGRGTPELRGCPTGVALTCPDIDEAIANMEAVRGLNEELRTVAVQAMKDRDAFEEQLWDSLRAAEDLQARVDELEIALQRHEDA